MATRQFGHTWWGRAWLDAVETRALTDRGRLGRGRTYARQGRVGDLTLEPGLVSAPVQGTEPYLAQLGVRRFDDLTWDRLVDLVVRKAAHSAALLTGELPSDLDAAARNAGISLLPNSGDLVPDCTCPDWGDPCKHVAAICYLLADLIDGDPFILFLLRGRGRDAVLTELRKRRSGGPTVSGVEHPRGADRGMAANDAYRRTPRALPRPRMLPRRAMEEPRLRVDPPADSGVDAGDLAQLVRDAAHRALELLHDVDDGGLTLDEECDIARRAALGDLDGVERAAGRDRTEIESLAIAWNAGRREGVRARRAAAWKPAPALLTAALALFGPEARARENRVSLGPHQLRLMEDHVWWPFFADDRLGWVVAGPGADDPAEAIPPSFPVAHDEYR